MRDRLAPLLRRSICFLTAGAIASCFGHFGIGVAFAAGSELVSRELQTAWAERNAGKVTSAISRLQRIVEAPPPNLSLDDRWTLTDEMLHICVTVTDWDCVAAQLPRLAAVTNALSSDSNPALQFLRINEYLFFDNTLTFWAEDQPKMKELLATSLGKFEEPAQLRVYIDRQLLLARYHLFFEEGDAARLAVDRAFTLLLSLDNIAWPSFLVASWLSEMAELFAASGDSVAQRGFCGLPTLSSGLPCHQEVPSTQSFVSQRPSCWPGSASSS